MARPSKLTPERQARLCEAIGAGLPRERAAEWAGIGSSTFFRWLERGRTATSGRYREFWEAVEQAELRTELLAVGTIVSAIQSGDWRAAESFLKRRHPERWGNTMRLSGPTGGPIEVTTREQALADGKERARHLRAV